MSSPSNTQAQTGHIKINTPSFKHQLSVSATVDSLDMIDTINRAANQARSVLIMLEAQFLEPKQGRLSDAIIFGVLESAIQEINNIESVVNAYHHAENANCQA